MLLTSSELDSTGDAKSICCCIVAAGLANASTSDKNNDPLADQPLL